MVQETCIHLGLFCSSDSFALSRQTQKFILRECVLIAVWDDENQQLCNWNLAKMTWGLCLYYFWTNCVLAQYCRKVYSSKHCNQKIKLNVAKCTSFWPREASIKMKSQPARLKACLWPFCFPWLSSDVNLAVKTHEHVSFPYNYPELWS